MKNKNSLLWIQIMFVKCCMASISVSSDFTIQPSLDQSSNIGSDSTKRIGNTATPFLTTETSGILTETIVKTKQSLTAQSQVSPISADQISSSKFNMDENTILSYSRTGVSSLEPTSTSISSTKLNSVIKNSIAYFIPSDSVNSFSKTSISPVNSLETVSESSPQETKSSFDSESAQGTIETSSKSSLETAYSQLKTVSDISNSIQMSMTASNINSQSAESPGVISSSKVISVNESDLQTSKVSPKLTLNSQSAEPSSAAEQNTNASVDKSFSSYSYISFITSEYSSVNTVVIESESIQSLEFNSMHTSIQSVISGSSLRQTKSTEGDTYTESKILTAASTLSTSIIIQPTKTISVISGTAGHFNSLSIFPQTTTSILNYSGSSSIVSKSPVSSLESITQIQPSPVSTSMNSLDAISSIPFSIYDEIKDSNSVSVQTVSILSASELSSIPSSIPDEIKDSQLASMLTVSILSASESLTHSSLFATSSAISGSMYPGKSIHFKETVFTSVLNSPTTSSPFTSSLKSSSNVFISHSSKRVSTDLNKVSSTVTHLSGTSMLLPSTNIISVLKQSPATSTSSNISSEEISLTSKIVSTEISPFENMVISAIPSNFLQMSMSPSSITHSSITNVISDGTAGTIDSTYIPSNNVNKSMTQATTQYRTVIGGTITYNFLSSESETFSSNFIRPSSETYNHFKTQSSGIIESALHGSKSSYVTISASDYGQFSSSILSSNFTHDISTSMFLVSQSGLTRMNSLYTEIPSSTFTTIESLFLSALSNTFSSTDILSKYMSDSASLSSNTDLFTSSMTQESLLTLDMTKAVTLSSHDVSKSTSRDTTSSLTPLSFKESLKSNSNIKSSEVDMFVSTMSLISPASLYSSYKTSFQSESTRTILISEEKDFTSSFVSAQSNDIRTKTPTSRQVETSPIIFLTKSESGITSTYLDISPSRTVQIVSSNVASTEQYTTVPELISSSNTPEVDRLSSSSILGSTGYHLTERYSGIDSYSSVSSEISKSIIKRINSASDAVLISSKSESFKLHEVSSGLLSSIHTDASSLSASVISPSSTTYVTLPAQPSFDRQSPTSYTPSLTIVTSVFSPSVPLLSSTVLSEKSSSIYTNMSETFSFISATSVQSNSLEQTDMKEFTSRTASPIYLSPSQVSSSLSDVVSRNSDENSTIILNITESELVRHEISSTVLTQHMTPTTNYSIFKSFETGNSSLSLLTDFLSSSELSIDAISTSYKIKTDTSLFIPSIYFSNVSTVNEMSNVQVSKTSSLSYVSIMSNGSNALYTSIDTSEITLASTYVTDMLTFPVLTDSTTRSQYLLTTLPVTLTSLVESNVGSDQPSVSASSLEKISHNSLSVIPTKSGTINKTSSASLNSTYRTTSVDLFSISPSMDQLTPQSNSVGAIPATSTTRLESSLYSSISEVSLYTDSFKPSSVDHNTRRSENTSQSVSSLYYLSTTPSSYSDMTSSLTSIVGLTFSTLSEGTNITTHARSSTLKTLVTESPTLSMLSSRETYSSVNSQYKLTISGVLSSSFILDSAITNSESVSFSSPLIKDISSSYMLSLVTSFPQTVTDILTTILSSGIKIEAASSYQSMLISSTTFKTSLGSISASQRSTILSVATDVSNKRSPISFTSSDLLESSFSYTIFSGIGLSSSEATDRYLTTLTPLISAASSSISLFGTKSSETSSIISSKYIISPTKTLSTSVSTTLSVLIPTYLSVSKSSSAPTLIPLSLSSSIFDSMSISDSTLISALTSTFDSNFLSVSLSAPVSTSASALIPTTLSTLQPHSVSSLLSPSVKVSVSTDLSASITHSISTPLSASVPIFISTTSSYSTKLTLSKHLSDLIQLTTSAPLSSSLPDSESTTLSTSTSSMALSNSIRLSGTSVSKPTSVETPVSNLIPTLLSTLLSTSIPTFLSTSLSDLLSISVSTPSSVSMSSLLENLVSNLVPKSISTLASASVRTFISSTLTAAISVYISKPLSSSIFTSVSPSVSNSRFSTSIRSSQMSSSSLVFSQTTLATPPLPSIQSSVSTVNIQSPTVISPISTFTLNSSVHMTLTSQVSIPVESSVTVTLSSFEPSIVVPTTSTISPSTIELPTILSSESLVTDIKSTTIFSNQISVSLASSTKYSSDISQSNQSTIYIPTSRTMFSMVTESLTSFSISLTSVTRTVTMTTSSLITTTTTTTQPPEQTTINATNARESNWARTVLKVQRYVNISDPNFVKELERRFAEAFNEAFIRLKLIKEGKFEPLEKRRRRKRFTSVGDASVHIHDVSRVEDTTKVTAVYAVEKSDKVLSAEEAVSTLDVLDTQELAIILKQVVDVKAEPYTQSATPTEPEEEASQLLLYAAIAGGVGGTVILIWIIACIYCKCCRQKRTDEDAEPELTSIQPQSSKRKDSVVKPMPVTPKTKTLAPQGSKFSLRKGRTYEINNGFVTDNETDEQTLLKSSPRKKKLQIPDSPYNGSTSGTPVLPNKELVPPAVKKGRRNSKNSIGPTTEGYENEIMKYNSPKTDRSHMFQSSISEDSEDTKLQLKAERKRNKDRMAEKYRPELEAKLKEREQPKTESKILGMPNTAVPSFVIESGSPVEKHKVLSRKPSDENTSGDENLQEARNRMHKLLDEAFSLISPRNSLTEIDISSKQPEANQTKPLIEKSKGSKSSPNMVDVDKALGTLRGFTSPGYTSSYSEFLETWSPYRGTDQVALISMPNKPEPSVTRLGNKSEKRPMTSSIVANGSRRPAANLEISNIKSVSEAPETGKYATTSPKPIVIRTKDDAPNSRSASAKSTKMSNELQNNRKFSATALNSDMFLRGSSTSLTKPHPQGKHTNDSLEMQTMKKNRKNSIRSQRESVIDNRNKDDIDVIKNIKPEDTGDNLYKSLKEEIKGVSNGETTEEDINKKPIRRRNRKAHSKPMTDIV